MTISEKPIQTVNLPLYNASTVLFESCEDLFLANAGEYEGITYGTDRLPNQRAFEEAVKKLEGGFMTRAFPSGINAITSTFLTFAKSGDHIILCENVYGPTARFCRRILTRYNIETTFVPSDVGADIEAHIRPNTVLIFMESPGSNTFEIQDISAVTSIARQKGIVTVLDNTWATPLYLKPFELGIDVSIHSVTKYISGHSDVLLGTATVNEKHADAFEEFYSVTETFAPSRDCYLSLRGLHTLTVRLKQHELSALKIAAWLQSIDMVGTVIHPALPEHPQHHLWKRYFTGSSGLFGFIFKEDYSMEKIVLFVNALEHFGIGFSWGGYKSLITAGKYRRSPDSIYAGKTIIRLNIGLEDSDTLIKDLEKALLVLE